MAQHLCIMCRDFTSLDKFAFALSLSTLWKPVKGIDIYEAERKTLKELLGPIMDPAFFKKLSTLRLELAAKERYSTTMTEEEAAAMNQIQEESTKLLASVKMTEDQKILFMQLQAKIDALRGAGQLSPGKQTELSGLQRDMSNLQRTLKMTEKDQGTYASLQTRKLQLQNSVAERMIRDTASLPQREAMIKRLEAEDDDNTDIFTMKLFALAVARKAVKGMDDHIGRARLICAWLAGSVTYTYTQGKIDSLGTTVGDSFRDAREFCAGYATVFVNMFNTITRKANVQAKTNNQFLAVSCLGITKPSSLADTSDKDKGHAWAVFPMTADANGAPIEWKVVDPCWLQGGHLPEEMSTLGLAKQWFYNTNRTFMLTHLASDQGLRVPPARDLTTDFDFERFNLAPFDQDNVNLQIEESSLRPQNYVLAGQADQLFQFSRLCPGSRMLPGSVCLVPLVDKAYLLDQIVPFDVDVPNPVASYRASMNTRNIVQKSKTGDVALVLAIPFADKTLTEEINITVPELKKMPPSSVYWKVIAHYKLVK